MGELLKVAKAAERSELKAHTLRYYEQQGLLCPQRDRDGRRLHDAHDLRRLQFLRRMRQSGMSMGDLRRYVALTHAGAETVAERRALMFSHQARIEADMSALAAALDLTRHKIASYGGHPEP